MKCITVMGTLDSGVLGTCCHVTGKISIVTLLLHLSLGISKIMLLVIVDSVVSGLLSSCAGQQGIGCSVKNVAADKSMVLIFPPCWSEVEISYSPGMRNTETRISL